MRRRQSLKILIASGAAVIVTGFVVPLLLLLPVYDLADGQHDDVESTLRLIQAALTVDRVVMVVAIILFLVATFRFVRSAPHQTDTKSGQ